VSDRSEPFPAGTRVHHRGAPYSLSAPCNLDGGMSGGWGRVSRATEQGDGSYEYEVERDRDHSGRTFPDRHLHLAWWGSHHIDRALHPP
jgi:hypothetical protein